MHLVIESDCTFKCAEPLVVLDASAKPTSEVFPPDTVLSLMDLYVRTHDIEWEAGTRELAFFAPRKPEYLVSRTILAVHGSSPVKPVLLLVEQPRYMVEAMNAICEHPNRPLPKLQRGTERYVLNSRHRQAILLKYFKLAGKGTSSGSDKAVIQLRDDLSKLQRRLVEMASNAEDWKELGLGQMTPAILEMLESDNWFFTMKEMERANVYGLANRMETRQEICNARASAAQVQLLIDDPQHLERKKKSLMQAQKVRAATGFSAGSRNATSLNGEPTVATLRNPNSMVIRRPSDVTELDVLEEEVIALYESNHGSSATFLESCLMPQLAPIDKPWHTTVVGSPFVDLNPYSMGAPLLDGKELSALANDPVMKNRDGHVLPGVQQITYHVASAAADIAGSSTNDDDEAAGVIDADSWASQNDGLAQALFDLAQEQVTAGHDRVRVFRSEATSGSGLNVRFDDNRYVKQLNMKLRSPTGGDFTGTTPTVSPRSQAVIAALQQRGYVEMAALAQRADAAMRIELQAYRPSPPLAGQAILPSTGFRHKDRETKRRILRALILALRAAAAARAAAQAAAVPVAAAAVAAAPGGAAAAAAAVAAVAAPGGAAAAAAAGVAPAPALPPPPAPPQPPPQLPPPQAAASSSSADLVNNAEGEEGDEAPPDGEGASPRLPVDLHTATAVAAAMSLDDGSPVTEAAACGLLSLDRDDGADADPDHGDEGDIASVGDVQLRLALNVTSATRSFDFHSAHKGEYEDTLVARVERPGGSGGVALLKFAYTHGTAHAFHCAGPSDATSMTLIVTVRAHPDPQVNDVGPIERLRLMGLYLTLPSLA